ncbi:MAG: hypothetical protein P4L16_06110 [Chlamydiales bacterium]|nr:hypothetical protein [Chlamydiales bacterium]
MMTPIFTSDKAYCVIDSTDDSFITFSQGIQLLKSENSSFARWFDKVSFQDRFIEVDSFQQKEENIYLTYGEQTLVFYLITKSINKKIKVKNWLRKDLIREFDSDQDAQDYFTALNAYS